MTKQENKNTLSQQTTEPTVEPVEQSPKAKFLNELYDEIADYLKSRGGKVYTEFEPQRVDAWESYSDYGHGSFSFSFNVERAMFIRDDKKDFALVLGRGHRSRYEGDYLRLHFGFLPRTERRQNLSFADLRMFVHQFGGYGKGEFYASDYPSRDIEIDCWANDKTFGGEALGSYWKDEKVLSEEGKKGCLRIVQRTLRQAYSPKDLT